MSEHKHHCDGKVQGQWPCSAEATFRVGWITNPTGLPGMGKPNHLKACALHMGQVAKRGTAAAVSGHVHVLPAGSELKWWVS